MTSNFMWETQASEALQSASVGTPEQQAVLEDDTCQIGSLDHTSPDHCAMHALQFRAQRMHGGQHDATHDRLIKLPPAVDYTGDVRRWQQIATGPQCSLPRASFEEANRTWSKIVERIALEAGEENPDRSPWAADRPKPNMDAVYARARDAFQREMFGGHPGIIEGVGTDWPAQQFWKSKEALVSHLALNQLEVMTFTIPDWSTEMRWVVPEDRRPNMTMAQYLAWNESARNFYFFVDELLARDPNLGTLHRVLKRDTQPTPDFAPTAEERHSFIVLDGIASSHGLHQHEAVWLNQVMGRHGWWLLPPSVTRGLDWNGGPINEKPRVPIVDGTAYDSLNACEFLERRKPPSNHLFCVQHPGETLLLPSWWWHGTCALDEMTAAAGGWLYDVRVSLADGR
eukprot:CAMPEP_0115444770 /NCGR_PEP_ID=MMETSP0271-20121206/38569_1 /TAXON_ID=71861 /ORGANISM="Scrippsiella trochoidea, Strain CCMP3099" /LENGTH=398 /DNA_ID=CAMNT_0002870715 /DNA_START=110 /DNA_END=1306 /DNA_ORIENTATION=-